MRILVTGGAGFIGSHLAERLLADGHSVTALDNLSTGSYANVAHLESNERFQAVIGDVESAALTEPLVREADSVVHLAAAVGVRLVCEEPIRAIETNIFGAHAVMRACARYRKKVLIASSSEVYGCAGGEALGEDDDITIGAPPKLRWSYAASKALDEFLALAYWHQQQLPTVVARLFNTVGPRQTGRYGMVIPRLIDQALMGVPLTVYGDGSQRRCFTAVADTVEALVRLMTCPGAVGEVVNVGSHNEIAIVDLARRIVELTGSRSAIETLPFEEVYGPRFQDMERRRPNITKLKRLTGFAPKKSLDDILTEAIAWAKTKPSHPV